MASVLDHKSDFFDLFVFNSFTFLLFVYVLKNTGALMKNLLVYVSQQKHAECIQQLIFNWFTIYVCTSDQDACAVIDKNPVYAVLQDCDCAMASHFSLVRHLASDLLHTSLPVLIFSRNAETIHHADICLQAGCSDLLIPPMTAQLLKKRIDNAVRSKESFTFTEIENILRELPSNIYLKDREGKYVFCTQYWHHIRGRNTPHWTIRGKTDLEIRKDKANALKAMESDKKILATGEGTTYVIEEKEAGVHEYLELIKRPTHDSEGNVNGIVALINDVTEKQLLKMELERRAKTDPLTGLLNKVATEGVIELSLEKFTRSDSVRHAALFMIDVDNFKMINDTFGHSTGDNVLRCVGSILHSTFSGKDVKGRVGGDEFMVFAEIENSTQANRIAEAICRQMEQAYRGSALEGKVSLSIGICIFPEVGSSFQELYKSADQALYTVKKSRKGSFCVASSR